MVRFAPSLSWSPARPLPLFKVFVPTSVRVSEPPFTSSAAALTVPDTSTERFSSVSFASMFSMNIVSFVVAPDMLKGVELKMVRVSEA
jgi:hypothetical protein